MATPWIKVKQATGVPGAATIGSTAVKYGIYNTAGPYADSGATPTWTSTKLFVAIINASKTVGADTVDPTITGGSSQWFSDAKQHPFQKGAWVFWGQGNGNTEHISVDFGADNANVNGFQAVFFSVNNADLTAAGANAVVGIRWAQRVDGNVHNNLDYFGWPATNTSLDLRVLVATRFNGVIGSNANGYSAGVAELDHIQTQDSDFLDFVASSSGATNQTQVTATGTDFFDATFTVRSATTAAKRPFQPVNLVRWETAAQGNGGDGDTTNGGGTGAYSAGIGSVWGVAPASNSWMWYAVVSTNSVAAVPAATLTANGTSFSLVDTATSGLIALTLWRGLALTPTTAKPQVGHGGNANMTGCASLGGYITGIDTSGSNGSGAVAQHKPGTSASSSLSFSFDSSATQADSLVLCVMAADVSLQGVAYPFFTPGDGFSMYDRDGTGSRTSYSTPNTCVFVMVTNKFLQPSATIPGAGTMLGVAAEILHP